jgi:hypothetical protein
MLDYYISFSEAGRSWKTREVFAHAGFLETTYGVGSFHVFTLTIDVPHTITEFTLRQVPRDLPVANEAAAWSGVKALFW